MTRNKVFLSVISGLLLSVAFPPFPIFITAFFAFVPLFFVFEKDSSTDTELQTLNKKNKFKARKYPYIYITFFIYHLCSNYWISSFQAQTDPYLLFAGIAFDLLHPFFFFVPFAVLFLLNKIIHSKTGATIFLFPFIWTIFEWLFSLGDLGYPWLSIAHTQYKNIYWYQIVDIAGIWGATFLISLVNALIFWLIKNAEKTNNKRTFRGFVNTLQKKIICFIIYIAIIVPYIYGFVTIRNYDYEYDLDHNQYLNIGLIQPNINPWNKWQPSNDKQLNTLFRLQDSIVNVYGGLDLCVWPETAIPIYTNISNKQLGVPFIEKQILERKTSVMSGIMRIHYYQKDEPKPVMFSYYNGDTNIPYSIFNTAFLMNIQNSSANNNYHSNNDNQLNNLHKRNKNNFDITYHDKAKLTPFAENFPFVENLFFAKDWLRWGVGFSSWTKGNEQNLLIVGNEKRKAKIAPIICIESIYPDFVRKFTLNGANILSVITNDAWYNYTSGLEQHYIIDATRAIENRRYLIRCGNSGVTGFISPIGTDIFRADEYKETAIAASIPILDENNLTIYTKYGNYFPIICCAILVIATLWRVYKQRRK